MIDNLFLAQPVDFGYIGPTELELLDSLHSECEVILTTMIIPLFLVAVSILSGGRRHFWLCGRQAGLPHHSQVMSAHHGGEDDSNHK